MQVELDSIVVKKRIRKNLGDLDPLVSSFKKYGQLNPIIINRKLELIAGYRRLEAAKILGWRTINAIIMDRESEAEKLEIELEENIQRSDLDSEEISNGYTRLEKLKSRGLLRRLLDFLVHIFQALFKRGRL